MGFFDDAGGDPFEDIINEFFGHSRGIRTRSSGDVVKSEREERVIDYIEEKDKVYFVFELPGFRKEDVEVKLKGNNLNIVVEKKNLEGVNDYLRDKLSTSKVFSKTVPVKIKKDLDWTFNNGVLEVKLIRK